MALLDRRRGFRALLNNNHVRMLRMQLLGSKNSSPKNEHEQIPKCFDSANFSFFLLFLHQLPAKVERRTTTTRPPIIIIVTIISSNSQHQ